MKKACISIVAILITTGSAHATDPVLKSLFLSPHERQGDFDTLALEWISILDAQPRHAFADVIADRLEESIDRMRHPSAMVAGIKSLLDKEAVIPVVDRRLRDLLGDLYRRLGQEEARRALHLDRGYLTHWAVIGPLGLGPASELDRPFPIESTLDFGASYESKTRMIRWHQREPRFPTRWINARDVLGSRAGIYYHLTQLRSQEDRTVTLHLDSHRPVWILVNSRPVLRESGVEFRTSPRSVVTRLKGGWNRILVKIADANFSLLVTDMGGNALGEDILEPETHLRLHETKQAPKSTKTIELEPAPLARLSWPDNSSNFSAEDVALHRLAFARRCASLGRPELLVNHVEAALNTAPEAPGILYQVGELFNLASHLPTKYSRQRAREAYQHALAGDSGLIMATLRLADLDRADEQTREAVQKIQSVLASHENCLPALYDLWGIYDAEKWEKEAVSTAHRIVEVAPESPRPYRFLAEKAEGRWNITKALRLYQESLERDYSQYKLFETIARLENDQGHFDKAVELLEHARQLRPGARTPILDLAELHEGREQWQEALELLRPLAESSFDNLGTLQKIAKLEEAAGQIDAARQTYRKLVTRFPDQLELARYLEKLEGNAPVTLDRFWLDFDETLTPEKIDALPDAEDYPKSDSLAVIDVAVLKIHADGTTSEYIHQAFKLLSEASKENLAKVRTAGEVVELRTVGADGTEFEPASALGQGNFVMPGLEPGAIVEFAYRRDSQRFENWIFRAGPFYFQDFNFKQPFLLTRYVVLVPPELDVDMVERGFAPEENSSFAQVKRSEVELPDGGKAVIYEARNAPRMRPEINMPHRDDYIPNVHVIGKRSWTDVANRLTDIARNGSETTPRLQDFAHECLKDVEHDPILRARALYDKVNELIKTDNGPADANGILLERAGDRNVLYKALLDVSDIVASWAFVRPREEVIPAADTDHPNTDGFNSRVVAIEVPGRDPIWVTLSSRKTPFGKLPFYLHGGTALVLREGGATLVAMPEQDTMDAAESLDANLKLGQVADDPLAVEVSLDLKSRDYSSCAGKTNVDGLDAHRRKLYLRRLAGFLFPGARVQKSSFVDLDKTESPLRLKLELTAPEYLMKTDDEILLQFIVQPMQLVRSLIRDPERHHPYNYARQLVRRDRVEIELSERFSLEKLPPATLELCPLGSYALRFVDAGEKIIVQREVRLLPGVLTPEEYPQLIAFCQAVDEAESARLVLSSSE